MDIKKQLIETGDVKNLEMDAIDATLQEGMAEEVAKSNGDPVDSSTDSELKGGGVDGSDLKTEPVVSDDVKEEAELNGENAELNQSTLETIKAGDKTIYEKIGELFELKTAVLRRDIQSSSASLKSE